MPLNITSIFAITHNHGSVNDPEFGIENLLDSTMNVDDDTYWLSEGGEKNWIIVKFQRPVDVEHIGILSRPMHFFPRRNPAETVVYALTGQSQEFEHVGQKAMYRGSNRITLEGAVNVRELLITFPEPLPVLVNGLTVLGRAPLDVDRSRILPRIATENRESIDDILTSDQTPESSTHSAEDCFEFEDKLSRCNAEHECTTALVDRMLRCVDSWRDSDTETGLRLLEIHRLLLTKTRISALSGCPRYFFRWGGRGSCQYDQRILVKLENQFPNTKVLYDAAWMSSGYVSKYYECECNWDCVIEDNLYSVRWFLEQYPGSPYFDEAVNSILETIALLDQVDNSELHYSGTYSLAEEIRDLKMLAPRMESARSDRLLSALALLESRLQEQFPDLPILFEPDWRRSLSITKHPDCANHWDCIIENRLYSVRWYLERHPGSPYREKAVNRALEAIDLLDDPDSDKYEYSRAVSLAEEVEAFESFSNQMHRHLGDRLRRGLARIKFRLEVEELFAEITSGNPSRNPLQYMAFAREQLIDKLLQSKLETAPEPKDEWMLVLFEIAETSPHSNATLLLCRFAETRYEAAQNWLLEYQRFQQQHIDPSGCHPDLAGRMRSLIEN